MAAQCRVPRLPASSTVSINRAHYLIALLGKSMVYAKTIAALPNG
jgi:hypothetical protein